MYCTNGDSDLRLDVLRNRSRTPYYADQHVTTDKCLRYCCFTLVMGRRFYFITQHYPDGSFFLHETGKTNGWSYPDSWYDLMREYPA